MEWNSSRVSSGAVLVNLISKPDVGVENTFTEFVGDAKLCRETEVLEGRVAIEQDHSKLQGWARGSSMNFTKQIGKTSPIHQQRLGLTGQGAALLARILGCCWARSGPCFEFTFGPKFFCESMTLCSFNIYSIIHILSS